MNWYTLAWKNANGSAFRSWVVGVCAALMAGLAVAATIIIGGARTSLNLAMERLGADIIVVPEGTERSMENAFLMGVPVKCWMPRSNMDLIAGISGVQAVSPQFYLSTLRGASCCSVPEMFLIAYEPETDFTLRPWLEEHHVSLALGEAVGGSLVYVPLDPGYIQVYGYDISLRGNLDPTGTGIDQSMFFTFDTARDISRLSPFQAVEDLVIPPDSISAVMVKTAPGEDPHQIALQIKQTIPDVTPVESTNLFRSQRVQILDLLRSVMVLLALAWALAVALIGLVFAMAMNERRHEFGVLRALGLPRPFIAKSLLAEAAILAGTGGIVGVGLVVLVIYLFRNLIVQAMGVPFLIPAPLQLLGVMLVGLALALASVTFGALIPILRIGLMDPVVAMRK